MNKFLKLSGQIVGLLIIVYIVIMLLLLIFVKTKDFTPIITKLFYQKTGQVIRINGKIVLSIFPWPAVRASNVIIDNPKQFQAAASITYLAKISKIKARLKVIDLLHGNIQLASVSLNHLDLNLVTSPSGQTNWDNLTQYKKPAIADIKNKDNTAITTNSPKIFNAKQFPIIQINNANIHFINLESNSRTDVTKLSLNSPASRDPLLRQVVFSTDIKHDDPDTHVSLRLNTLIHFVPENSTINLEKMRFSAKWYQIQHPLPKPITLIMRGKATLRQNYVGTTLSGNFGEGRGQIALNAEKKNNRIVAALTMKNVLSSPLMIILTGKDWLDGNINASARLTTQGKRFKHWISNLNGEGNFKVTDGNIQGIDMNGMVINTLNQALSQSKQSNPGLTAVTAFKTMSLNYTIDHGQLNTNNFLLDTNTIKATGKGKINLPNTKINATLVATYVKNPEWQIPLKITGPLFKPTIQADTKAIAQQIIRQNAKKGLGNTFDKLSKQLKSFFD